MIKFLIFFVIFFSEFILLDENYEKTLIYQYVQAACWHGPWSDTQTTQTSQGFLQNKSFKIKVILKFWLLSSIYNCVLGCLEPTCIVREVVVTSDI